jgi:hypothetical protein
MTCKFTTRLETRYAAIALAALFSAAMSLSAHAAEVWKVNFEKSKFSSDSNTLVLDRDNRKGVDEKGNPSASTLLIVSNGGIYLAMDEATYNATHNGVRTVAYPSMPGMKLMQIGYNVRYTNYCGFRCQSGLPDTRITVTFTAKGVDPRGDMSTILAFEK